MAQGETQLTLTSAFYLLFLSILLLEGVRQRQLELGHAIHNVDMQNESLQRRAFKEGKGSNKKIPEGSLTTAYPTTTTITTTQHREEQQLDQARLLEGQLRIDLEREEASAEGSFSKKMTNKNEQQQ